MTNILTEIQNAQACTPGWDKLNLGKPQNIHIAIMSEPFLSYIFKGSKTVESRFSLKRVPPYMKVGVGDIVFIKAGPIVGYFIASWVESYDLTESPIELIRSHYGPAICGDDDFWKQKSTKRYVTLIGIEDIRRLTPVFITKRDRRGWVTLR